MDPILEASLLRSLTAGVIDGLGVMGRLAVCPFPPGNNQSVGLRFSPRQ